MKELQLFLILSVSVLLSACQQFLEVDSDLLSSTAKFELVVEQVEKNMVKVPGRNFRILRTEVTQHLYESVSGYNPAFFSGPSLPVEKVSWYDAIYFCNVLSMRAGLVPAYAVNENTEVACWNYVPGSGGSIAGVISWDKNASGYRLPSIEEWSYAALGGEGTVYSGSSSIYEVGWYAGNSSGCTHAAGTKKPNAYGIHDMTGNVWEWCWELYPSDPKFHYLRGGSWGHDAATSRIEVLGYSETQNRLDVIGFRICRSVD